MRISQLDKNVHDRNKFDCKEPALNNFLKLQSGQNDKKDLSRTFVLTSTKAPHQIKGFYSLAMCKVNLGELPPKEAKKFPNPEIFCALIGRIAVNSKHQGQGFGDNLLIDALRVATESSMMVPTPMIIIDAKNARVKDWYEKFGFIPFPKTPDRLFMTLKSAKVILKELGILS